MKAIYTRHRAEFCRWVSDKDLQETAILIFGLSLAAIVVPGG